mgnify:FL=1
MQHHPWLEMNLSTMLTMLDSLHLFQTLTQLHWFVALGDPIE